MKVSNAYVKVDNTYVKVGKTYVKVGNTYVKVDNTYVKLTEKYSKKCKVFDTVDGGYIYVFLRGIPEPIDLVNKSNVQAIPGLVTEKAPLERVMELDRLLKEGGI